MALAAAALWMGLVAALPEARGAGQRADGQSAPAATPNSPPASVSGTVTDEVGGQPVGRARVLLQSPVRSHSRVVLSDERGRYAFDGVPPGEYELTAVRTGYVLASAPPSRGVAVSIAGGETRSAVAISLRHTSEPAAAVAAAADTGGSIRGRLQDEDGTPLGGADVEALSLRSTPEQQPLKSSASARTNVRGEFLLTGLAPGQYFVMARDRAFDNAGDETGALRYPPTYFPGVLMPAEAEPLSVGAGRELPPVEFRIRIVKPSHLRGVMKAPDTRPLLSGAVMLVPRAGGLILPVPSDDVDIRPDGTFVFRNVPPGNYQLRARAVVNPKEVMLFGSFAVTITGGRDLDGISLTLAPGAVVRGQVQWFADNRQPAPAKGLRVRAPFADGTSFGDVLTGEVGGDGSFRLQGVMTGQHYFAVDGLPPKWAVSAVLLRGNNVESEPVDVHEGEQLQNVRIVLSQVAEDVRGSVRDAGGRAVAGALVLALPPGSRPWTKGHPRFRSVRTDDAGRFEIAGLPRGAYRIAAVAGVDELAAWRPDWLRRIIGSPAAVSLAADGNRTLDLVALHADALVPAAAR